MQGIIERVSACQNLIKLASLQEREDGNPIIAARHYLTLLETLISILNHEMIYASRDHKLTLQSICYPKIKEYQERVCILLNAAREMELEDVPEYPLAAIPSDRENYDDAVLGFPIR